MRTNIAIYKKKTKIPRWRFNRNPDRPKILQIREIHTRKSRKLRN